MSFKFSCCKYTVYVPGTIWCPCGAGFKFDFDELIDWPVGLEQPYKKPWWKFWVRQLVSSGDSLPLPEPVKGQPIDIDGNEYKTVEIGSQVWMAENLKVTRYRNGDAIPNVTIDSEWKGHGAGAYCDFNNSESYAPKCGHLYNYDAVVDGRNIAPKGWHVPTNADWWTLIHYLGGKKVAGDRLREAKFTEWAARADRLDDGEFDSRVWVFWSATAERKEAMSDYPASATCIVLEPNDSWVWVKQWPQKAGLAVRCVKD